MKDEGTPLLTIVIPARNEERNLPLLLTCLSRQDTPQRQRTKVYLADAGSTDRTREIAQSYKDKLDIEVIPGGLPSVGRNAGAKLATTKYVLFIDADMEPRDTTLVRRSVEEMERRRLQCLTVSIACSNGILFDHALYAANNLAQRLASWTQPFGTGMYMMFEREAFERLGGFDEKALYAEDYLLTKKVPVMRFGILWGGKVYTTNRRFAKMGRLKILRMFLWTALNSFNKKHFYKDQDYWTEYEKPTK